MSTPNGGPAFPVIGAPSAPEDYPGMTLRDYFAATALHACLRNMSKNDLSVRGTIENAAKASLSVEAYTASMAYEIADAMLAERAK